MSLGKEKIFIPTTKIDMKSLHIEVRSELQMELNPKKMRRLVREFGTFPTKHRQLVWRYILSLPQNTIQFRKMIASVPLDKLPKTWSVWIGGNKEIRSNSMKTHLSWVLSWLLAWSPDLSSVTFLPEFVLPFVRVLRTDPTSCFELLATVLCNWGHFWLEMNLLPPFHLMSLTEELTKQFGHGSFIILKQHSINVTSYAWPLLEHGFARVLDAEQWAQLWDHLLANRVTLMVAAAVAYVSVTENSLRTYSATTKDLKGFYSCPHPVNMKQFLRKAYEILDTVTNWPAYLSRPVTCLPDGAYPNLAQLLKSDKTNQQATTLEPVFIKKREAVPKPMPTEKPMAPESMLVKKQGAPPVPPLNKKQGATPAPPFFKKQGAAPAPMSIKKQVAAPVPSFTCLDSNKKQSDAKIKDPMNVLWQGFEIRAKLLLEREAALEAARATGHSPAVFKEHAKKTPHPAFKFPR